MQVRTAAPADTRAADNTTSDSAANCTSVRKRSHRPRGYAASTTPSFNSQQAGYGRKEQAGADEGQSREQERSTNGAIASQRVQATTAVRVTAMRLRCMQREHRPTAERETFGAPNDRQTIAKRAQSERSESKMGRRTKEPLCRNDGRVSVASTMINKHG